MGSILNKPNRHLFIEDKDNMGNSFIANVNFLVNKFSDIKDINSKFTAEDIVSIRELLDSIKNASPSQETSSQTEGDDQTEQQSSSDKISQDLGLIIEDLIKGSLHGCRKLDINLLKNFADYDENMTDDEKRQLWNQNNSQVYYSSMDVYFVDKTFITKEFTSLVRNHHQLRDQMHDWPELAEKMEGTGIEIVPNRPLYNHELLRIYDTTLEGSAIESVVLHVADEEQCGRYAAVFSGVKDHNPRYSWMDTTSAIMLTANILPTIQSKAETALTKANEALENALQAESLANQAVEAKMQACECAAIALEAKQDIENNVELLADKADIILDNIGIVQSNTTLAYNSAINAQESASKAEKMANLANRYSTNAAVDVLEKVQAGILTARYEDYPEFLQAYLDMDGNFLFGIRIDGSVEWAEGIPQPVKDAISKIGYVEENDKTYIRKYEDAEGHILFGIRKDGSIDWPLGVPQGIKNYLDEHYGKIEDDSLFKDYLHVYTDKEGKFIFGIKENGDINWVKGTPDGIKEYLNTVYGYQESNTYTDYIKTFTDLNGQILFGIKKDGSIEWSIGVPTAIKEYFSSFMYRDHEGNMDLASIHDTNGNVLEATDYKGKKVFYRDVLIDGDLKVTGDIKGVDKIKGVHNWSKRKDLLHIPIPECAVVKITGFSRPVNKIDMHNCKMEFWDMRGNYFEKKIALGLQGNSTWNLPKPNYKFDLFADDWNDDKFSIKFGDWVAQDSFHLKAFYTDFLCGRAIVAYQWWQEICKTRGILADTSWKQALLKRDSIPVNMPAIDTLSYVNAPEEDIDDLLKGKLETEDYISYRLDSGAKCVPDGFPCIVYINDTFHGIFSWQLKKHKDNYHLKKNKYYNIHIDGFSNPDNIWMGNVVWRVEELRYPKDLFCYDGSAYDADRNMKEIMSADSELYLPRDITIRKAKDRGDSYLSLHYRDDPDLYEKYQHWDTVRKDGEKAYDKEYKSQIEKGKSVNVAEQKALEAQIKKEKDSINKILDVTVQTKPLVERLSQAIPALIALDEAYDADPTPENYQAVRTEFEQYFYPDNLMDYNIFVDLNGDGDSIGNNCQWITWDGNIWFANVYDCNGIFGGNSMGNGNILTTHRARYHNIPFFYAHKYYKDEIEARYAQLRKSGILDPDHIFGKLNDWVKKIGIDYYKQEFETWYLQPSINSATVNTQYWKMMYDENGEPITGDRNTYDPGELYDIDDEVYSSFCAIYRNVFEFRTTSAGIYKFRCIKPNRGIYCFRNASLADNIWHLYKWYETQLTIMDGVYEYDPSNS